MLNVNQTQCPNAETAACVGSFSLSLGKKSIKEIKLYDPVFVSITKDKRRTKKSKVLKYPFNTSA